MPDRLAEFDTCCLSDALDALGLHPAISGLRRQSGSACIVGRAVTIQLTLGTPSASAPKIHLGARAVEESDEQSIIVISHPGIDAGGWGGVLTRAAIVRGVRGVVLKGSTRDIDEANDLDFPIFCEAVTARTARGRLHETATNVDIRLGECDVAPGDYVVADDSGVVIIAQHRLDDVLDKARHIKARETDMIRRLESGIPATQVLGADYEDLLKR